MMINHIIFICGVWCLVFGSSSAAQLVVIPHKTSSSVGSFLSFTCHADEPITSCKIYHPYLNVWLSSSDKEYENRRYDLHAGVKHTYNGRGFANGDCGILITKIASKHDGIWECRVETKNGEVLIETVKLDVNGNDTAEELSATALQSESAIGDTHTALLCHSNKPIEKCEFQPPNADHWIPFKNSSIDLSVMNYERRVRYLYYGSDLQNGDCGLFLKHAQPKDNGVWRCRVNGLNGSFSLNGTVLLKVVARPQPPVIAQNTQSELSSKLEVIPHKTASAPGGILSFTCHSDEPIQSCSIYFPYRQSWQSVPQEGYEERLYDLTTGVKPVYNGRGYGSGDCGILITDVNYEHDGDWKCKVKTQQNGKIQHGEIRLNIIENEEEENLTATALQDISNIGENHSAFICHFNEPIDKCEVKPPGKNHWIPFKNSTYEVLAARSASNIRQLYYGSGLQNGDCGLFLKNIRKNEAGEWTCKATVSNSGLIVEKSIALKVASPVQPIPTEIPKVDSDQDLRPKEDPNSSSDQNTTILICVGVVGVFFAAILIFGIIYVVRRNTKKDMANEQCNGLINAANSI